MKRNEFNVEKISNEENSVSFEFGSTQDAEFTSYKDNQENIRDELNDNSTSNEETKHSKKEAKRKQNKKKEEPSKKDTNQSLESTISSSASTVATVVGASLVTVVSLSAMVGINVFFNGKCQVNLLEPTSTSVSYQLDLSDIKEDECIIKLENGDFSDSQSLVEGFNSGTFTDLMPLTKYNLSVIDITYNNYVLYEDNVSTKELPLDTFTITFVTNGGSEIESQVVNSGDKASKPTDSTREDYNFEGWYSNSELTEEYDFDTPVMSDISLYAKWEELPKVTISFEANGGTGEMETDYQYLGKEYILPECTLTAPNGYVFDCWQISSGDSQYKPGEGYLIQTAASVTFIAVWAEAATVEFYPGIGATGSVTSLKVAIGKEYEIPSGEEYFIAPTNQEFDYWFDDMYSEQRHAGDVITIEDTYYSFTAHWKYLDGLTFTVTFDSNGGSEVEPQVVNAGTNATKPDNPTKDDYIFKGWYSNSELTNSYNFLIPVTSDITLYAKWEEDNRNVVSFDANGGSGEMESIKTESVQLEVPECTFTAPENYVFDYWYIDGDATDNKYYPGDNLALINKNTTLTASWIPDADFSFHIEYFDTLSSNPTNNMQYKYAYTGSEEIYLNDAFIIMFKNNGNTVATMPITFDWNETSATDDITIPSSDLEQMTYYDMLDYQIIGYVKEEGSGDRTAYTLTEGSVRLSKTQKTVFNNVYINGIKLEDNAVIPYFARGGSEATLPLQLDYYDYDNSYHGFNFYYQVNGASYSSGVNLTATRGMQYVFPTDFTGDSILLDSITIQDTNYPSNTLKSYSNITVEKIDTAGVFGFELVESELSSLSSTGKLKIKMVGNGYSNGMDINNLTGENFKLTIEPQVSSGSYSHLGSQIKFELPFTPNSDSYIASQCSVTVEDVDALIKYLKNYALTVTLSYYDTTAQETVTVTSYIDYTFAYAG